MSLENKDLSDFLVYLKLFERMNQKLFIMYGVKTLEIDAFSKYYYITDEFSDCFFRITGYEYDKSKKQLSIVSKNGLLSLLPVREIYDISQDLDKLLQDNIKLISALKLYRNKAQHIPHSIGFKSLGGTNDEFDISFEYNDERGTEKYKIKSIELCKAVTQLNEILIILLERMWNCISLETKQSIHSAPKIELLFRSEKYKKFNQLLQDKDKKYFVDLME